MASEKLPAKQWQRLEMYVAKNAADPDNALALLDYAEELNGSTRMQPTKLASTGNVLKSASTRLSQTCTAVAIRSGNVSKNEYPRVFYRLALHL